MKAKDKTKEQLIAELAESKELIESLRESEARYRLLTEMTSDYALSLGVNEDKTIVVEWRAGSYQEMIGRTPQLGKTLSVEYTHPDDAKRVEKDIARTLQNEKTTTEYRKYKPDGTFIWIRVHRSPVWDEKEKRVIRFYSVVQDITKHKQAEEKIEGSSANLAAIIENTSDSIWAFDTHYKILYVNTVFRQEFYAAYGVQLEPDVHLLDSIPKIIRSEWKGYYDRALANERFTFEKKFVFPGNIIYTELAMNPILSEGKVVGVSCFSRNITERKEAEEELSHLQKYLANIIDSMPSTLIGVDSKGFITQWNSEAEHVFGLRVSETLGLLLEDAVPRLSAEMDRVYRAMQTREVQRHPRQANQKDGVTTYEDVTVYPLVANGVEGVVIRVDDVTEEVRMQEMMIQSEKMLSVGGLAAGMAHEINNPLAGMMQTADNMSNRLTNIEMPANLRAAEEVGTTMEAIHAFMDSRGIPRMLRTINESGHRVAEIVDNMLSFARKSDAAITSLDIEVLLNKALELASTDYSLKRNYDFRAIEIVKEYENYLPYIPCEESKMQQVFLNILRNGAQAMHKKGNQAETSSPRFILRLAHEKETGMLRIEFEDNGPGMDEAIRKRVFEPFFTTKPVGEGTGLGLSVSYFIIIENHDGTLDVTSEPGQGANFIIRLPLERMGNKT